MVDGQTSRNAGRERRQRRLRTLAVVLGSLAVIAAVAGLSVAATAGEDPTVEVTYDPDSPTTNEPVDFTATTSGFDSSVGEIQWYVDESPAGSGETFQYTFSAWGEHNVTAVATDEGTTANESVTVTVSAGNEPPNVGAIGIVNCRPSCSGSPELIEPGADAITITYDRYPRVELVATGASDRDGDVEGYVWKLDGQTVGSGEEVEVTPDGPGSYQLSLTLTDDSGATSMREVTLELQEGNAQPTIGPIGFVPCAPECDGEPVFPADVEGVGQEDLTVAYEEFQSVALVAPEATDDDGEIVEWRWEVEDFTVGESERAQHTFEDSGDYNVALVVRDDAGSQTRQSVFIDLNRAPTVEIGEVPETVTANESASFEAAASDPDGSVESVEWTVDGESVGSGATLSHAFTGPGTYELAVTATDDDEFSTSATVDVEVEQNATGGGLPTLPMVAVVVIVLAGIGTVGYLRSRH